MRGLYISRPEPRGEHLKKLPFTSPPTGTDTVKRYRCGGGGGGGLLDGISVSVQTGNIIRVHMVVKYG